MKKSIEVPADERRTHFHKELRRFLYDPTQRGVFRIDGRTVGVTDGPLSKAILAARPMYEPERIVFKPIRGVPVSRATLSTVMKAVGQDARRVAEVPPPPEAPFEGIWPSAGYRYLQYSLYAADPWPIRVLVNQVVNRAGPLKPTLEAGVKHLISKARFTRASLLAQRLVGAAPDHERWAAVTLYRRTGRSVCATVASLVTNVLWLASPVQVQENTRHCITETLRLLPPAWMYHRNACGEFAALDRRIRPIDDVLVIPFITQRDPNVWPDANVYRPERWTGISNPEASDYFFPWGHSHDRCLARELVLMLAEHTVRNLADRGLWTDRRQTRVSIPLKSLLSPKRLRVVPL
jgi:hypothetical protein